MSKEIRTYEIESYPDILDQLEKLFYTIQYLGSVGASRTLKVDVDGDGMTRIVFKKDGERLTGEKPDTNQSVISRGLAG